MTCFDYDKQKWVTGQEAVKVRLEQLRQERDLLKSDRAAAYLMSVKCSDTVAEALAWVEGEIVRLGGSLEVAP